MSLSFVSSAVLSSTDGVSHNEEKAIESKEATSLRNRSTAQPLYDQLRSNQDADQEKYDEIGKAMRAGMRPLDEEDCAHLDSVEKTRLERDTLMKQTVEQELALFRAARADRSMTQTILGDEPTVTDNNTEVVSSSEHDIHTEKPQAVTKKLGARIVPIIIGKRKRKEITNTNRDSNSKGKPIRVKKRDPPVGEKKASETEAKKEIESEDDVDDAGLGGLLGCYSSSEEGDSE
eukprot:scaffold280680_cov60-Attheya_sp.AAC.3